MTGIRLPCDRQDLRIGRLDLEQVRAEVEVVLLHLDLIDRVGLEVLLHVVLELLHERDARTVGRVQVGDVLADVLAEVLAIRARVEALGHGHAEDPLAALLRDRRVGRHRDDLRDLLLRRDVGDGHGDRAAGGTQDQVHLVLVDEPVDVRDALVGLALVVEQDHLDFRAVDAALGVDRLHHALRDVSVGNPGLDQHPQRDADADRLVLRYRGLRLEGGAQQRDGHCRAEPRANSDGHLDSSWWPASAGLGFGSAGKARAATHPGPALVAGRRQVRPVNSSVAGQPCPCNARNFSHCESK